MNSYSYEAEDVQGEICSGEVNAQSIAEAVTQLSEQGLTVRSINLLVAGTGHENEKDAFLRRLQAAMDCREQWLPLLSDMENELPPGVARNEIGRLKKLVKRKTDADEMLGSNDLPTLLPLLAASQEQLSGDKSAHATGQLAEWLSLILCDRQSGRARKKALVYPAMLLIVSSAILVLLSFFLVPIYRSMFEDFGLSLPAPTLLLLRLSDALNSGDWWILLTLALAIAALAVFIKCWRSYALSNRLFGIFASGTVSNLRSMSFLARGLAELLSLQAPLAMALEIAGRTCGNHYYSAAAQALARHVNEAGSDAPILVSRRLPPTVVFALQPVDRSFSVSLLRELAGTYATRAQQRIDWLSSAIPVISMLLIGLLVAFVAIALLMPLVLLISALA